jgi:hypothetical protein
VILMRSKPNWYNIIYGFITLVNIGFVANGIKTGDFAYVNCVALIIALILWSLAPKSQKSRR